jgi:hypothetical protein
LDLLLADFLGRRKGEKREKKGRNALRRVSALSALDAVCGKREKREKRNYGLSGMSETFFALAVPSPERGPFPLSPFLPFGLRGGAGGVTDCGQS